ncbi:MAG: hypothetical protein AAGC55_33510, partial [Myxococcota bacterium]
RFALGRSLGHACQGTGALVDIRPDELAAVWAGAARAAGLSELPPALAAAADSDPDGTDERAALIYKHLSRRDRKTLAGRKSDFAALGDGAAWRRSAVRMATRSGLLLAGAAGAAFQALEWGRGEVSIAEEPGALELLVWMVGVDHLALRRALGLRV